MKGYHGMVMHSTLFRTGTKVVPQLFPEYADKDWLQKSIKDYNTPYVNSLDEFDIVQVTVSTI